VNANQQLALSIPLLVERPAVGTSCCVTTAEALIAQELWMLPGILELAIDPRTGRVDLTYDASVVSPGMISTALGEIGYPPAD
jgi:hypothetical protein